MTEPRPSLDKQFYKNLIRAKDDFRKKISRKSNNMHHLSAFKNLQNHLNQSIQLTKQNYVNKIAQKPTSSKCYWSLLLNGKKIPCILPLFHGDENKVDFQEKSEIFNSFFSGQCSPISNGSVSAFKVPLRIDSKFFEEPVNQTQIKFTAMTKLVFVC